MKKIIFTLFFLFPLLCNSYEYELTICAIFCEDDLPYMKEWIDFHEKQGVEHIYLYNHLCDQEKINSHLSYHINEKFIEVIEWNIPYNTVEEWNHIQQCAYMHCMNRIKEKSKWCAILDSDEFLFSPKYGNLKKALKNYKDYSGVVVNWIFYGTSNHILSVGEKLTDHLLYRQKLIPGMITLVKSIVKPKYVTGGFIHRFDYSKSYAVNENFQKIDGFESVLSCEIFRINHYWSRDKNFFFNFKIPRRFKWNQDINLTIDAEREMNVEFDDIIKNYN